MHIQVLKIVDIPFIDEDSDSNKYSDSASDELSTASLSNDGKRMKPE